MSTTPIDACPQTEARLIAEGTNLQIAEEELPLLQDCLEAVWETFDFDDDESEEQEGIPNTRTTLVVKSALLGEGSALPYDDVLAKLQSLPNLTKLIIAYDECLGQYATATMKERSAEKFPRLRLRTYELSCVFRGCELPMLASKNTLRRLTITPGALHPMTAAEMDRFLNGFKEVLPNLTALTLQFNRLKLRSTRESPMHLFSTLAAIELLEEMQSQLSLRELHIRDDDDQASLRCQGLILCRRLFAACLRPGLKKLSFHARLEYSGASGNEKAGKEKAQDSEVSETGESEKEKPGEENFFHSRLWRLEDAEALLDCLRQYHKANDACLQSAKIIFCMPPHETHKLQLQDPFWMIEIQEKLTQRMKDNGVKGEVYVVPKHLGS